MTPKRRGRHRLWTDAEDSWLRREWGKRDLAVIAVWLQRTVHAVSMRARKLKLNAARQTRTLRAFARLHSVPISKVYWAIQQRQMRPQRVRRTDARQSRQHGAHFALSPAQQDELLSLIKAHPRGRLLSLEGKKTPKGVWGIGIKPPCCRECGTTERPHFARGYCRGCHNRVWRWMDNRRKGKPTRGTPPKSLVYQPEE